MSRRKGEMSPSVRDQLFPHQIVFPAAEVRARYDEMIALRRALGGAERGHSVVIADDWHIVFCFPTAESAAAFSSRFGGAPFDPKRLGRGARWHLPKG
jgi:hypothetical protein